jgi:Ca2+-binding RTX toxin-like protein
MSYVTNIPGAEPGYDFFPLLTVGQEVPEIQGSIGNFSSTRRTFALTGTPDGMGLYETPTYNYLFINHEFGGTTVSDISSTIPGQIQGARVSLFVFDKNMNIVGGKNLIQTATDTTGTYTLDTTTGNYLNAATGATLNFSHFCSGYLAASGFVDANGNEIPIYFAPEETTNFDGSSASRGWAVSSDGNALALDGLGRYAKEQVYSASQYRATNSDKTVLFGLEDNGDGELYMYVGTQTPADPNGFQSGQLYALKVAGHDWETLPEGTIQSAAWTAVPQDAALDPKGLALNTFVNTPENTTNFRRLEDMHEDPNNPGTFYFVTTGRTEAVGSLSTQAATPAEADNPYGKLYRLTLNPTDPTAAPSIELVHTGGLGNGVSFDNITVDTNGNVLLQEDETAFGGDVMTEEARDGQIWSYDITSDTVVPIGRINEEAAGSAINSPAPGEWESSGIIEFLGLGANKNNYLFNVQAHTIKDETLLNGRHVEGGQILAAIWRGDDVLTASGGHAVFGNQGNDELTSGGTGSNVLYGGKNDDTLTGLANDVLLGEKGEDVLIAGNGGNNILTGGENSDRFVIVGLPATAHVITDFTAGELVAFEGVSGAADFASLTMTQSGADALISVGGTNVVRLTGIQTTVLTSSSFEFA